MRTKHEVLTTRQLNPALLARQHLLERRDAPLTRVIDDVGGLQNKYAPAGYTAPGAAYAAFNARSTRKPIA